MSNTDADLQRYSYLYKYDSRRLQIGKKLPGCSWLYYVYDKGRRLIFSQDGNQRCRDEWSFCIPDMFGRILLTGVCSNTFNFASSPLNHSVVEGAWSNTSSTTKGYSIAGITLDTPLVLTANFYDDYCFAGKNEIPDITSANVRYDSEYESEGFGKRHVSASGLLTGTLTAQMSGLSATPGYLYSVKYYDSYGRLIQSKSSNHLTGGVEKEYIAYNFIGQSVKRKHIHSVTGKAMQTELYSYIYNPVGGLQSSTLQLNGGTPVTLLSNEYDDLERLISTQRGNGISTLTSINQYNVRNWLTATENPLFSQHLFYTDGTGTPCFNGNISSMTWKMGNEQTTRGYRFEYDPLSRLKSAAYGEGEILTLKPNHFDEQITGYDKNGNVQGIKRYGQTSASTCGLIDDLSISLNGNQLQSVNDAVTTRAFNGNFEFKNDSRQTEKYAYDTNGNLIKDLNKKITTI